MAGEVGRGEERRDGIGRDRDETRAPFVCDRSAKTGEGKGGKGYMTGINLDFFLRYDSSFFFLRDCMYVFTDFLSSVLSDKIFSI